MAASLRTASRSTRVKASAPNAGYRSRGRAAWRLWGYIDEGSGPRPEPTRISRMGGSEFREPPLVEVAGIEPASFDGSSGLLRVQPAVLFSAPAVTQASCRRAQSLFDVPSHPVTGREGEAS